MLPNCLVDSLLIPNQFAHHEHEEQELKKEDLMNMLEVNEANIPAKFRA